MKYVHPYLSYHKTDQSSARWTADFPGNVSDFHSLAPSPPRAPPKCCEVLLTCFPFTLPWHTCWNPQRDSNRGLVIWYVWDFLPYQPYPTRMSPGEFWTYCPHRSVSIWSEDSHSRFFFFFLLSFENRYSREIKQVCRFVFVRFILNIWTELQFSSSILTFLLFLRRQFSVQFPPTRVTLTWHFITK